MKTLALDFLRGLVMLSALWLLPQNAVRANVMSSFVVNGNGTVTYSYTVGNSAGSFDISAWSLEFPFSSPDWNQLDQLSGGSVTVPNAGWFADAGIPISGQSAQDFLSLSPASDVLIGNQQSGFSFTSLYLPGVVTYHEFSATGASASGTTMGPAILPTTVPESDGPYALLGLAALVAFAAATRTKKLVTAA